MVTGLMTHYQGIRNMLTTGQVARLFRVQPCTVRRWNARGRLKAYRIGPRGERRFRREDVDAFVLTRAIHRHISP